MSNKVLLKGKNYFMLTKMNTKYLTNYNKSNRKKVTVGTQKYNYNV